MAPTHGTSMCIARRHVSHGKFLAQSLRMLAE